MNLSITEAPSGLVHLVWVSSRDKVTGTVCGREVNEDTWVRVRTFDGWLDGKGKGTISIAVRNTTAMCCDRCFPLSQRTT
jgi:hypothetical protein